MQGPSPLLGYNTNVRHAGKLYHIQTEDSGIKRPHIITHLFADGGRIIATKKSSYAEHVGAENLKVFVKKMMQEQHKAMFIALRDGVYDEPGEEATPTPLSDVTPDPAALERAAAQLKVPMAPPMESPGRYQSTRPAIDVVPSKPPSRPPSSIFGSDLLSEKSLDEVILSYLAEDLDEKPPE